MIVVPHSKSVMTKNYRYNQIYNSFLKGRQIYTKILRKLLFTRLITLMKCFEIARLSILPENMEKFINILR